MALIKCPECGKEISEKAPKCVHCGYQQSFTKKAKVRITIAFTLQLVAIILLIAVNYIYVFDGLYKNYVYSKFGREHDYSYYQLAEDEYSSNIFLRNNTVSPDVEVTGIVELLSYVVVVVCGLGVVVYLYILLSEKSLNNYWFIPILAAVTLVIHSIVVSASNLSMIEAQGYYDIRPSILWFVVLLLEISSALLGRKSAGIQIENKQETSQPAINSMTEVFIDAHGNFYCAENNIGEKDNLS